MALALAVAIGLSAGAQPTSVGAVEACAPSSAGLGYYLSSGAGAFFCRGPAAVSSGLFHGAGPTGVVTAPFVTTGPSATQGGSAPGGSFFTGSATATSSGLGIGGARQTGFEIARMGEAKPFGDGNGFEDFPGSYTPRDGRFAIDRDSGNSDSASCADPGKDRQAFRNFPVRPGLTIIGIEVRLDAYVDATGGSSRMCVQLSWNGGGSWTTVVHEVAVGTGPLASYTVGGPSDTWGRSWIVPEFSETVFQVLVTDASSSPTADFFLDSVAVNVHYQ